MGYIGSVYEDKNTDAIGVSISRARRNWFILSFSILMVLVVARYAVGAQLPREVIMLWAIFCALISERSGIIAVAVCCAPLYSSMQFVYVIGACIVIYLCKYMGDIRFTWRVAPVLLLFFWELLHCMQQNASLIEAVRIFIPLFLCALLISLDVRKIDYYFVTRTFAICTLAMCFIVLYNLLESVNFDVSRVFRGMYRFGASTEATEDISGAFFNANYLGFLCIMSVAGLLPGFITKKANKTDVAIIILLVCFGVMTMSKSFVICALVTVILFVTSIIRDGKRKIKTIFAILLGIVAVYVLLYNLFPSVLDSLLLRFQAEDLGSGRSEIFRRYNQLVFSDTNHTMFGIGIQNVRRKAEQLMGAGAQVPHNGLQEILVCWGIPGLCMILVFFWCFVSTGAQKAKRTILLNYIPFIIFMLRIQTGQFVRSGQTVVLCAFTFLSICQCFADVAEEKDD